ncbi:trichohyalin-like [Cimex lectularius]|uniref:Uncharacterized protein n=1 Tax=Cimex lectularius TaxID=79782 RepID=A0A8I6RFK8_CIMLE|nr:trichohyalin-like [Cimex lectularius]
MAPPEKPSLHKLHEGEETSKKKRVRRRRRKHVITDSSTSQEEGDRYRVIKSVSDFSLPKVREYAYGGEEPMGSELYVTIAEKEKRRAIAEKEKFRKRLTLEALGEERRLRNKARKDRMIAKKLINMQKEVSAEQKKIEEKKESLKKENVELIRNWKTKQENSSSEYTEDSNENNDNKDGIKVTTVDVKLAPKNKEEEKRRRNAERRRRRRLRKTEIKKAALQTDQKPNAFIKRPEFDKTEDHIFLEEGSKKYQPLSLGIRAKMYKEYEQKKEKMNMAIDRFCEKLKTQDGRPIRMILIDDSKCLKSNSNVNCTAPKEKEKESKYQKKPASKSINIPFQNEGENWEDRLKRRIREDRVELDKVLIELKQKVEEKNYQKKLIKEEKKVRKEKLKDRKLMIKLLKERIKEESRSTDFYGRRNLLLTMKEQQVVDKPIETKLLLSGSKYILNNNPVKDMLVRLISRSNRQEKEDMVIPSKEDQDREDIVQDKELEELGDQLEEKCFRKISKEKKRKEGKINKKKLKCSSASGQESNPTKAELALMNGSPTERAKSDSKTLWLNTKLLRKKERRGETEEANSEKRKHINDKIVDLWKDMIKRHSNKNSDNHSINSKLPDYEAEGDRNSSDGMEEINLTNSLDTIENEVYNSTKPLKEIKENKFKRKLKLPPLKLRRDLKFLRHTSLNPLSI